MTTEEKFNAAVNVVKNLPRNGVYQPSSEILLKFYSYYKQATEGPCTIPKPAFWEVIKKAKWHAWSRLGDMDRLEAMDLYVEELKKIVETMAYTENVATFLGSLDSFYESVPVEDLEMIVGPVLDNIYQQADSPMRSKTRAEKTALCKDEEKSQSQSEEVEIEEEFLNKKELISTIDPEKRPSKSSINAELTEKQSLETTHDYALANGKINNDGDPTEAMKKKSKNCVNKNTRLNTTRQSNSDMINDVATVMDSIESDLDQLMIRISSMEHPDLLTTRIARMHYNYM